MKSLVRRKKKQSSKLSNAINQVKQVFLEQSSVGINLLTHKLVFFERKDFERHCGLHGVTTPQPQP